MHEAMVKFSDRVSKLGFEDASGLEAIRKIPGALVYVIPDPLLIEKLTAGERALESRGPVVGEATEKVAA